MITAFVLAALANWQMVETFHHGSLFEGVRARLEAKPGLLSDLMLCPFCLSHWTGVVVTSLAWVPLQFPLWWAPIFWLAVVRVSNVLNDLGHDRWRTAPNLGKEMEALADLEKEKNERREREPDGPGA
jgi:hypothetical protein